MPFPQFDPKEAQSHSAHWGAYFARSSNNRIDIQPHPADPSPSPLLGNVAGALDHRARVLRPSIRKSWLTDGPRPQKRGLHDPFVEVSWEEALDLLADTLSGTVDAHGASAIYGGSYGWASAGRFHHAQSQIHRFLNTAFGGYMRSVGSYSAGASSVILPHIMGPFELISRHNVTWDQIRQHTDTVLAFGGMALRNSMIGNGGVSAHIEPEAMRQAAGRGTEFHLVSPIRDDLPEDINATWHTAKVGTDVALILGLAHTLIAEGLQDEDFLRTHCHGFSVFSDYLQGKQDSIEKDAAWASAICGIEADAICQLARRLTHGRSLITVSHSLQRARFGEQPVWAAVALAAMVGQIGLPGGGFNYSLGAMGHTGRRTVAVEIPTLSQGVNMVEGFIPCARISDMLLNPGAEFEYDGRNLTYPEIKIVYWAGGNPYHHHQDLNRLQRAFERPETIVVQENAWTAMARSADIVLPATMTLERNDIGATRTDPLMIAMRQLRPPVGEARNDYDILAELSDRLGCADSFTEGRSEEDWLRALYECTRQSLVTAGHKAPDFDSFWRAGQIELPLAPDDGGFLRRFRENPAKYRVPTSSGKIELFCEDVASFGYSDCPGHPVWRPSDDGPTETAPLFLIANAPSTRLHSQLDFGGYSQASKVHGREPARLHPADAQARGIRDGDVIRVFNSRGSCLAGARISDAVARGVMQIATGAWYDPMGTARADTTDAAGAHCRHGNPNVLCSDIGTSSLSQGCTGQVTVVDCERFDGDLPPIRAFDQPDFEVLVEKGSKP